MTVSGSPIQEQEALSHQISRLATDECLSLGAPPLFASVTFRRDFRIAKKDVAPVAKTIADLVSKAAAHGYWSMRVEHDQLPECVDDLLVYCPQGLKEPFITTTATVWVPEVDDGELFRNVLKKEAKLAAYRQECSEVWLLIVVDGFRVSSVSEVPTNISQITSAFDRVILLHDWASAINIKN